MDRATTIISPVPPYDFELTAAFQSRYGLDSMEGGVYSRLLDLGDKLVLATARSVGSINTPQLELRLQGEGLRDDDVERSTRQVEWLLGAAQDLLPFYSLAASDPVMAGLVERFYGLHPTHTATLFEALVLGVLGQQIAANVARIIRTLIIEQFGLSAVIDGETYYAFPRPDAIWASSPDVLRTMKLTQRKSEYIHGLAGAALDAATGLNALGDLPDEEVVQRLVSLRGIGKWTAQWALIRGLSRPNALPLGDLALRRVVSRLYFDGQETTDAQVQALARQWEPHRTYATVYLFTALRYGVE